jgi:hypothetical protein
LLEPWNLGSTEVDMGMEMEMEMDIIGRYRLAPVGSLSGA